MSDKVKRPTQPKHKRTNHKAVNFTLLSETMPSEHSIPQCLASVWRNTEFKDASKYR